MKSPRQLVYEKAEEWAKKYLEKIEVEAGEYAANHKCHEISRQKMDTNVSLVITLSFVPKSGVNVHFVNRVLDGNKESKYVDNTLGYLSSYNTYYKVAEFFLSDLTDYEHPLGMEYLLMEFKFAFIDLLFTEKEQQDLAVTVQHI